MLAVLKAGVCGGDDGGFLWHGGRRGHHALVARVKDSFELLNVS